MFACLGRVMDARRRLVLALAVVVLAIAGSWGTGVFGALAGGGFDDPGSPSYQASKALANGLGRDGADVIALYRSPTATVDDPAYRAAVTGTLAALPPDKVAAVTSYYSSGAPSLVSADRHSTYAVVRLAGAGSGAREDAYAQLKGSFAAPGLSVRLGGDVPANVTINQQVSADIGKADAISFPILLVLLVFVFGGLAAASLPLAVGGLAVLGAFTVLHVLTLFTDVSVFALNIIILLGLGLAIDYSLFVVSRFREELPRRESAREALVVTMATAGRTVAFSALTVAASLASLFVFPQLFLRSMAMGGIAAVLVAMTAALTVLPALLAVLGPRVNALRVPGVDRLTQRLGGHGGGAGGTGGGAWGRIAGAVMRRPVAYAVVIVIALLVLGSPFRNLQLGGVDTRVLPASNEVRQVSEALNADFTPNATTPVQVAVRTPGDARSPQNAAALASYAQALGAVPGVRSVDALSTLPRDAQSGPAGDRYARGDTARLDVYYDADPQSGTARALVTAVRAVPAPAGATVLVGGDSAQLVDLLASLRTLLPLMLLVMVAVTFALLFLAFGSVVLPAKAVVMNALSLTASFGAVVWIFQYGHLASWLGFTPTGTVEATQPLLMLAIAFGLSMDYEVFLLSRVREQYDRTGDTTAAVAAGLQRTGKIITSAALLLIVVIGAFSTSGITFIKMIGVGLAIAIALDATVVRALLVPATMRLLGRANWWAPRPLRGIYDRYGFSEPGGPPAKRAAALPAREPASAS